MQLYSYGRRAVRESNTQKYKQNANYRITNNAPPVGINAGKGNVMKYFLIGFAVWFALAWLPQFIKSWFVDISLWWKRKHANEDDKWIYEI